VGCASSRSCGEEGEAPIVAFYYFFLFMIVFWWPRTAYFNYFCNASWEFVAASWKSVGMHRTKKKFIISKKFMSWENNLHHK